MSALFLARIISAKRCTPLILEAASKLPRIASAAPVSSLAANDASRYYSAERVPPEDYQDDHLITDHLEYLDDMIGKTMEIEDHMENLRQTYAEKRTALQNEASPEEMESFFLKADAQKDAISAQLKELRRSLMLRKSFAVDAPDGTSDELEELFVEEAQSIINDSSPNANKTA